MAYKDTRIKKLYYKDLLVAIVWDTHIGLGVTSGTFKFETIDVAIKQCIEKYVYVLYNHEGEPSWQDEMNKLEQEFGTELTDPEQWKLVEETGEVYELWRLPAASNNSDQISLKVKYNIH